MRPVLLLTLLTGCHLPDDPLGFFQFDAGPGPVAHTERPPTAISGGTLAVADVFLVVADTDRDRVLLVHTILKKISYEINDLPEPGRVFVARDGRVHVALRGSGEVLSFWPRRTDEAVRTPVCGAPRGIAEVDGALWVACASGALYAFDPDAGESHRIGQPTTDLRDLVVFRDRIFASRFRAGEVVELDRQGQMVRTFRPQVPEIAGTVGEGSVGWRLVVTADRQLALLHQIAFPGRPAVVVTGYYGPPAPCGNLVVSALTVFDPEGGPMVTTALDQTPLAIDVATDPTGRVAFASAGGRGPQSARFFEAMPAPGCQAVGTQPVGEGRFVATARYSSGFAFQSLEPARVEVLPDDGEPWAVDLGGPLSTDLGHALFHDATSAGLACASCHPEGGDDGITWQLDGPRRTQFLAGGLAAPFHWTGDLPDFNGFLVNVFNGRMGGRVLAAEEVADFEQWLDEVAAPLPDPVADPEAVARGRATFEAIGCDTCHVGGGSDGLAHDVGTGEAFQTPALRHLRARLPLMHDGCAITLADRFRPECGGDRHGEPVPAEELTDLMTYLETL